MPREQVSNLKSKRRTKKNRGYAANCRFKRDKLQKELEVGKTIKNESI